MRRIRIHNQTFLVGFKWEQAGWRSHREILQEARGRLEYDRYVFAPPVWGSIDTQGQKGKLYALAPLLVKPEESQVAIYALSDADSQQPIWWVLAYKNGAISARSDRAFEKEQEAELFAESLKDTLGIETLERYDLNSAPEAIWDAFTHADKALRRSLQARVSRDVTPARVMAIVVGVILLMASIFGVNALLDYQDKRSRMASRMSYQQRQEQRVREIEANPEKHFPAAWMSAPSASEFITKAIPELLNQPLVANGWRMKSASCNGKSISLVWEATPFAEYNQLPFHAVLDAKNTALARSSAPFSGLEPGRRTQKDLLSVEKATLALYSLTQHFGMDPKLTFRKRQVRTVEKRKIECPWVSAVVELKNVPAYIINDHEAFAKAMTIPGLILNQISYSNEKWTLKGELYAR